MAMHHIRLETNHRQHRQYSLGKESISLDFPDRIICINLGTAEIILIINKIIMNPFNLSFHDSHIYIFPVEIQIKMIYIVHLVLPFLLHAGISGKNHTYIKILLVNVFRQRTDNIRQSSCFDKRNTF